MKKFIQIFIFTFIFSIISCNQNKEKKGIHKKENQQHWTYKGETSPEHWAEIEKNSDCNGKKQSPINIIDIYTKPTNQKENPLFKSSK